MLRRPSVFVMRFMTGREYKILEIEGEQNIDKVFEDILKGFGEE